MWKVPSSSLHPADGHHKIVAFFKSLSFYTNSVITISTLLVSSLQKLLVTYSLVKFLPYTGAGIEWSVQWLGYGLDRLVFQSCEWKWLLPFPRPPEWLWGPPTFLFNWYRSSFAGINWTGNSLLTSFHGNKSLSAVCRTVHYWSLFVPVDSNPHSLTLFLSPLFHTDLHPSIHGYLSKVLSSFEVC